MKKKLLLVYVFVAFVLLCTNVYAVVTMNVGLTADKTSVKPGEEVVVTVNLKNISNPVSSVEGYINIDEDVFKETIKDALVIKDNKIEVTSGSTVLNKLSYAFDPTSTNADYDVVFNTKKETIENNDCFLVMDLSQAIENSADILQFKFTVKDNATVKKVEDAIKIEKVVATSAEERTGEMSATLDINVVKANEPAEENNTVNNTVNDTENTNKNTNTNQNTNTNKNTNTNTNANQNTNKNTNNTNSANNVKNTANNTNTNKDNTVAGSNIPAAGAGFIVVPIIIFAVLAYISYNKYIKYRGI